MAIELPKVPDEEAALPRLVIPKVERVAHASDITPAFDLLSSGGTGVSGAPVTDAPLLSTKGLGSVGGGKSALAHLAPVPPKIGGASDGGGGSSFGLGAPSLMAVSDAEKKSQERVGNDKKKEKPVAAPSPPAPPPNARVDENKVVKEKEAVRVLRDEQVPMGEPFDQHVRVGLGAWIDPMHPQFKYFRIVVSSRAESPLPVVSKDIVFLLDASGSIANDRLRKCRDAVSAALRLLNTGDRFNVVAFRDKFSYAFPESAWKDVTAERWSMRTSGWAA